MTLAQRVYAQALMLSEHVEKAQEPWLEVFCRSAVAGMLRRLREELRPEDCIADFVAAGALFALAALAEIDETGNMERVEFGDVTLIPGGLSAASRCLRRQANLIITPYCKDNFVFRGV